MKLCFVTVTSRVPPWLEQLTADYKKKLTFWLPTEIHFLEASSHGRDSSDRKKIEESKALFKFIKPDDYVIVCDENGNSVSTVALKKKFEKILTGGKKRVVVLVGGAYGFEAEVKERSDFTLSLSSMVTTHHMAFAFICEQIYRAMTLIKGVKYHNE